MKNSKKLTRSILKCCLAVLSFVFIGSCHINEKLGDRKKNIWIGAYIDEVFKYPNPTIYTKDSLYILSENIVVKHIEKENKLIHVDDSISKILKLVDSDTINLFYIRARETKFPFEETDLLKNTWEVKEEEENEFLIKSKIYSFEKGSILSINTDYYNNDNNNLLYSEIERYKYRFLKLNKTYILQIFNESGYSYFGQIVLKDKNSFTIEFLNTISPKKVKFNINKQKEVKNINYFNVCNEDRILQYFNNNSGTNFNGGIRKIKNIFKNKFTYVTNKPNQNGYIRIRFIVNCKGDIGRFSIMELNEEYLPFSFDIKIVESIFYITRTELKNSWIPGRFDLKTPTLCDNYKHITFKIKEGKIIDIFP